jgi:hypothetical protein
LIALSPGHTLAADPLVNPGSAAGRGEMERQSGGNMEKRDCRGPSRLGRGVSGRLGLYALLGGCLLALAASGPAHAKTVSVNGTCTLREAFTTVNTQVAQPGCTFTGSANPDLILVPNGTFTETDFLELNRSATVRGNGVGVTILRGNSTTSSFFLRAVDPSNPTPNTMIVTFESMTIDHTTSTFVTGIYAFASTLRVLKARVAGFKISGIWADDSDLTLEDSTIENNSSAFAGGGILFTNPSGSLAIKPTGIFGNRSTISNNTSGDSGGGLYYAGWSNSALTNVTISGNHAVDGGGVSKDPDPQYLFFYHCTVANNTATNRGGGLATVVTPTSGQQGMKLAATVVGNNSAPNGPDVWGPVNQFDESLISNSSGADIPPAVMNGILDVSPNLDLVLRDLGGPYHTKVHRPFPGSPVLDAVTVPQSTEDQRKVLRPQQGWFDASLADMGAVEWTRLETEVLSVAANSPDPYLWVNGSQYSNGQGNNLQANGVNDFVTYVAGAGSLPAGTYNVTIGYKKGSNAGKFQVGQSINFAGPFTNVGAVQDGYSSSNSWVTVNLGNVTFGSTGQRYIRLLVTGKNWFSSSYQLFPDFIEITRLP